MTASHPGPGHAQAGQGAGGGRAAGLGRSRVCRRGRWRAAGTAPRLSPPGPRPGCALIWHRGREHGSWLKRVWEKQTAWGGVWDGEAALGRALRPAAWECGLSQGPGQGNPEASLWKGDIRTDSLQQTAPAERGPCPPAAPPSPARAPPDTSSSSELCRPTERAFRAQDHAGGRGGRMQGLRPLRTASSAAAESDDQGESRHPPRPGFSGALLAPALPGPWTHSTRPPRAGTVLTHRPRSSTCFQRQLRPSPSGPGLCHHPRDLPCSHPPLPQRCKPAGVERSPPTEARCPHAVEPQPRPSNPQQPQCPGHSEDHPGHAGQRPLGTEAAPETGG